MKNTLLVLLLTHLLVNTGVSAGSEIDDLLGRWKQEVEQDESKQRAFKRQVLPSSTLLGKKKTAGLQTKKITGFQIRKSSILSKDELRQLLGSYVGRPYSESTVRSAIADVNRYYRERGFLYSRVERVDNGRQDGVVRLLANEARISKIRLKGNDKIDQESLVEALKNTVEPVLNMASLSASMEHLRNQSSIRKINAMVYPIDKQKNDYAILLDIKEQKNSSYFLSLNNYQSPSIGSERVQLGAQYSNKFGVGSQIGMNAVASEGLYQLGLNMRRPISYKGLMLEVQTVYSHANIVESEFSSLDINSTASYANARISKSYFNFGIRHSLGGSIGWRKNETSISGYDFLGESPQNWISQIEWLGTSGYSGIQANYRLAYYQTLTSETEGQSLASYIQYNYSMAKQLSFIGSDEIRAKIYGQWALGEIGRLDQFSLGGSGSLRGYRQSSIMANNVAGFSLEYHLPLLVSSKYIKQQKVVFVPFIDAAVASVGESESQYISSAGAGLRWDYKEKLFMSLDWAYGMNQTYRRSGSLQDAGLLFNIRYQY